ncbi:MAG: IS200/IS605 family transposase [Prolixibacteraceae bacterium]|nr:IS200/IS605 family transposase [Prolixibacteraceae bacterium]
MSSTFTQLYVHIVFAVQEMEKPVLNDREKEIYQIIQKIIEETGHKTLIINGTDDHIHLLVKLSPSIAISNLVREIKRQSSYYINHHILEHHGFNWQEGYSAFTHNRSQVSAVYKFIEKQKEYHRHKSFKEEYLDIDNLNEDDEPDDTIFKYKYQ